jgi:carbonic anhydrase
MSPARTSEPRAVTADEAWQRLAEGNQRYAAGRSIHPNLEPSRRAQAAQGQQPFATILGCVDSRVPPELIFDCGLGDLFVIRTAGQVLDRAALGSLQFGVVKLHIPLLVVLGHQRCGAIQATIESLESYVAAPADIYWLVDALRPAVDQARGQPGDRTEAAVRANIERGVGQLRRSPLLAEAIAAGTLKIVGARFDLDSSEVGLAVP